MKKYLLITIIAFLLLQVSSSTASNSWVQKGDVGSAGRKNAVGFAIGSKGYITTGQTNGAVNLKDLWEYNQTTGTWTQKADFAGTARWAAVGFAVGNYGYVGTGMDAITGIQNDFYRYDPIGNSWLSISPFPGSARRLACAFATASKGYVGLGFSGSPLADFYEYNPGLGIWTAIAAFPGPARYLAVAASVSNKGYVGTGNGGGTVFYQDWYEYDPTGNSWSTKTDFQGGYRAEAMAFGLAGKIFVGTGYDQNTLQKIDCWEFDPSGNSWTQRADVALSTVRRNGAVAFAIGSFGYCATGIGPSGWLKDSYEYTPLAVGVEEGLLKDMNINVYPNPSQDVMTVDYELLKNVPATFHLMDESGREVADYDLPFNSKSISITDPSLNEGVYFYNVNVNGKMMTTGKILVIK